jgi:hypothetical protein
MEGWLNMLRDTMTQETGSEKEIGIIVRRKSLSFDCHSTFWNLSEKLRTNRNDSHLSLLRALLVPALMK